MGMKEFQKRPEGRGSEALLLGAMTVIISGFAAGWWWLLVIP